jgi:hypothetical protein
MNIWGTDRRPGGRPQRYTMTRLLIGLTGGLYTFDLDASGDPEPVLLGVQPMALAMDPAEHRRVYCATYNRGLWRSEDAGETWLPVGTPQGFFEGTTDGAIEPRETTFVSVDPVAQADGRHAVWVGTEPSRLYRSTDHGDTFELISALDLPSRRIWPFPPRPRTHHVQCIARTSDGCMHLAIEAGAMIRSHNSGRTFKDRLPDSPWIHTYCSPIRLLHDASCGPRRRIAETRTVLCRKPGRWRYLGLLRQGPGSSAVLVRPCHSSRQSRGHSSSRIAEPTEGPRAGRSVDLDAAGLLPYFRLQVFDFDTGTELYREEDIVRTGQRSAAISPDGDRLATTDCQRVVVRDLR